MTDADGKQQVTYNGWPLYTFVEDTRAGVAHGQGIASYGGRWSTVTAAGKAFASSTSTSHGSPSSTVPSRPSGPSGGGYGYSGGY